VTRGRVIPTPRATIAATVLATALLGISGATPARADIVRDSEYWLSDYGFLSAWNITRGKGVKVAIIDTGVKGSVPDLAGTVVGGTDVSGIGSADGQTPVGEDSEHGTLVASLLAGNGTSATSGIMGVAPDAKILSVSVAFGQNTGAVLSPDDQIAKAVKWAVDSGAKVINMSLTRNTRDWPPSWDEAFLYAFQHDVVVVAAAGNRGGGTSEVGAPATIPGVLTVGGVTRTKKASVDASSQGITIGISAPSEDLVGVNPNGAYVTWYGTSGATPIVSGLVALVRSKYPDLDAANVIERVTRTANPDGHVVPSALYGYGLIDPVAALTAQVTPVDSHVLVDGLTSWIRLHRRADVTPSAAATEKPPITPIPDPPLPPLTGAKTLLPTERTLTYVTVPLALVAGFGTLTALLGIGAVRHWKRLARRRER